MRCWRCAYVRNKPRISQHRQQDSYELKQVLVRGNPHPQAIICGWRAALEKSPISAPAECKLRLFAERRKEDAEGHKGG